MRLVVHIKMNQVLESEHDTCSDSDTPYDTEELLDAFKEEIYAIEPAIAAIDAQIASITSRVAVQQRNLFVDRVPVRTMPLAAWMAAHGITQDGKTSVQEFVRLILRTAKYADLDCRTLWLGEAAQGALGLKESRLSVFDLLRRLPEWLCLGI